MSDAVTPFPIQIPEADLDYLRARLRNMRWPEKETVGDWSQGAPLAFMRKVQDHWLNRYDWRPCEARLNALGSFVTEIDGLRIHFLHVRSKHENARPLILTHGWPGSILEFVKAIPALTDPTAHGGRASDAFHVVVPSLPGYGFSGKPAERGWNIVRTGRAWAELMRRLGYSRYVAQGGDWGAGVSTEVGRADPQHCLAMHLNLVISPFDPAVITDPTDEEKAALAVLAEHGRWGAGYSRIQSTRPQTLGYGLTDSPIGQAAWVMEKFWAWTDCDGDPEKALSLDEMLDNVMMYWLTATPVSSARLYWESLDAMTVGKVEVPVGCSLFPKEMSRPSRRWAENRYKRIFYWNAVEKGGHFAAFEQPALFVSELRACFREIVA
jgi:pimeloyl-ACP methyl ester carboxylesterase